MFVVSMKTTRPRLAAYGVALAVLVLVTALLTGRGKDRPTAATAQSDPVAYLAQLGYEAESQWTDLREITVPAEFDGAFSAYNDIQKAAGFDLSPYRGERVKLYTYRVTNHPAGEGVLATLYLHGDRVIAGDLSAAGEGGFCHGLVPRESAPQQGETNGTTG